MFPEMETVGVLVIALKYGTDNITLLKLVQDRDSALEQPKKQ